MASNELDMKDVEERKAKIEACEAAHGPRSSPAKEQCLKDAATIKTDPKVFINPAIYLIVFGTLIGVGFWAVNKYTGKPKASAQ